MQSGLHWKLQSLLRVCVSLMELKEKMECWSILWWMKATLSYWDFLFRKSVFLRQKLQNDPQSLTTLCECVWLCKLNMAQWTQPSCFCLLPISGRGRVVLSPGYHQELWIVSESVEMANFYVVNYKTSEQANCALYRKKRGRSGGVWFLCLSGLFDVTLSCFLCHADETSWYRVRLPFLKVSFENPHPGLKNPDSGVYW